MMKNTSLRYFLISVLLLSNAAHALSGIETEAAKLKQVSTTYMLDGVVEVSLQFNIDSSVTMTVNQVR